MENITIKKGWSPEASLKVARLYEEAFGSKFKSAIPSKAKRIQVLEKSFNPEFSFVTRVDGEIVGIAGFHTGEGSLTGNMNFKTLVAELGLFKGIWAAMILSLFDRQPKEHELVMDGIVVDAKCRGMGIGSMLLDTILEYASEQDFKSVRLDVIDSNPRAKKLYESKGFVVTKSEYFPYLKWLIGFSGAETMEKGF
jgi:ribosomal protein S18 acetylase RimI-like enzyme